jgi:hypothetical protein
LLDGERNVSTQEPDPGEPDDFARTDLRTGQPAPERSQRLAGRNLLGRLIAQITVPRAVVAGIATLTLAALVATQLGYTQRLIDSVRYRIQMVGVPELTETTIAPQPAAHLATANWEKIPLPAPASQLNDFSADPTDPESLLVCGFSSLETPTIHGEITPRGPIAIWLTRDAGKTWSRSQALAITGTYCQISRAPDAPQRLTVAIQRPAPIDPRCSEYNVLLSDDNGANWRATPTSYALLDNVVDFCSHYAFMVRGRLYLYSSWSTASPGEIVNDLNISLAHSDDGGHHWSEAGGDTAQYLNFRSMLLADGTIVTVRWPPQQGGPENSSSLWTSRDRGDSWRPLNQLQGIVPDQALAPFGAQSTIAATDRPLYLSITSHVPSLLLYLKAAQIVDNHHWAYLPPLPVKGMSADHIGITNILGVTASGKLLTFGVNPQTGIQADKPLEEQFDQQWLWSWDPHAARWMSLAPPLPVAWKWCSDGCWRASLAQSATSQQTILSVRGYVSENNANELYRLSLPAEIA